MSNATIYVNGEYASKHSDWHEGDSAEKSKHIIRLVRQNKLSPKSICDVGCGAGEIINLISQQLPESTLTGFDISPQAVARAKEKTKNGIRYIHGSAFDFGVNYDIAMAIDVFEHVEDYLGFLRAVRRISTRQIYHIPLDLSVQGLLRGSGIARARENLGHLHYFTKDTALATLKHTGHTVVDWFYTVASPSKRSLSWKARCLAIPRNAGSKILPDLTASILGGYSLMVLCE